VLRLAQRRTRCSQESPRSLRLKFTGLSSKPTTLAPTVGSVIDTQSTGDAWPEPTVTRPHRTVRCAKWTEGTTVGFAKEGKKSCTVMSGGAPDCPVRQRTEDKNCLPNGDPTAPSCLGAIKGTPRRMEQKTKPPLNIIRHLDSASTHPDHCV
jgi:hypothetical protein